MKPKPHRPDLMKCDICGSLPVVAVFEVEGYRTTLFQGLTRTKRVHLCQGCHDEASELRTKYLDFWSEGSK